ncbi:bifunctional phosphoribosyl-AMP cyclohydrolase/phosphoribosyl-ATP diphosphatase HisIE [Pseudoxanthomonas winnipegensis]|uniref:bifunctional phosphoribosyl-AMP cyclohydrolase/phosphoribosyl-ATP diphosphatase HisIE n=1 Tax=Pseudoxanthomonas winnipegensis TaxID=2480810 RepID=UPI00103C1D4F|nr:bifunctional phosphoribosyl-AMP cyclohydrolase/phosphoribosyl-ATP diphosphatase HisIE [Pseudoxanthomonas winnipegensis]TBV73481.1 bifunctional phosphoribosyl-AMP cyclohydrolase/phosphoribosyl-ATP diphosphatase HisIE [Pseudoxanthomonas winnipegensis]
MDSEPMGTTDTLDWAKGEGLLPAVVQDADTLRVLMLGYMNEEALRVTRACGHVTFFSRSKQRLWTKGETSGHFLDLVDIQADCDNDTLLVLARPHGHTCHLQRPSCFAEAPALVGVGAATAAKEPSRKSPIAAVGQEATRAAPTDGVAFLGELDALIAQRHAQRPEGSYTTRLFEGGIRRVAQKVGEEGVETALAGVAQGDTELLGESADLLYHLTVLLRARGLSLADAVAVLRQRHAG